jgi:hypothetical protein
MLRHVTIPPPHPVQIGSRVLCLDLPPREAPRSVWQAIALPHVLHPPGWRAEDVQFLEMPGRWHMCAGLVFRSLGHARL